MSDVRDRDPPPWRALLALSAAAVVLRVGTSLSRVDEYHMEGLVHGAYAQALLDGLPLWPSHAPEEVHFRSSIVMSWLSVPSFALLGPTTFALRLSGIVFHLLGLLALVLLVHRQFGRLASTLAGALFVLGPPSLARIAVLSYGDHVESLPLIAGTALLLLAFLDDDSGRRYGLAAALGLFAGLSLAFHVQSRLALAATLAFAATSRPRRFLRKDAGVALAPGLALGLVPLGVGDWLTGRNGLSLYGQSHAEQLLPGLGWDAAAKWLRLWTADVPFSLQYEWPLAAALTALLVLTSALGLAVRAAAALRAGRESWPRLYRRCGWFVVYPLSFSVAYALSRFAISHETDNAIAVRLLMPLLPFLLLPIAVAAARLWEAGRSRAAVALAAPALALGLGGSLSTWELQSIAHEPARSAVVWDFAGAHFAYAALPPDERRELCALERSLRGDPEQEAKVAAFLAEHLDRRELLAVIRERDSAPEWTRPVRYWTLFKLPGAAAAASPGEVARLLGSVDPSLRTYAAAAVGTELARAAEFRPQLLGETVQAALSPVERDALWRGFGCGLLVAAQRPIREFDGELAASRLRGLPPGADLHGAAFGLGFRIGTLYSRFFHGWVLPLDEVRRCFPRAVLPDFARGFGAGYRLRFLQPPGRDLSTPAVRELLTHFPPELEIDLRDGLAGSG